MPTDLVAVSRRRVAARFGALLLVAIVAVSTIPAAASARDSRAPAARRMLVLSLPAVTWADLPFGQLPNLRRLFEQSLVADLSLRGVHSRPPLGDAYVTISAGARAVGNARDGEAVMRADGSVFVPAFPQIVEHNNDLFYDAHAGALGITLRKAGISRAVIGNNGRVRYEPEYRLGREVADALADPDGVTPGGDVSGGLLTIQPIESLRPHLSPDAYLAAFRRVWTGRTVVMVEDSDLARYDAAGAAFDPHRAGVIHGYLRRFDRLLGEMLKSVDLARDAVMVVGPTSPSGGTAQLTVASLRAPGTKPGLAVSPYTRRSGFVAVVDIAPTILDTFRLDAPSSMEGRPFEFGRTGGSFTDRVSYLVDANHSAQYRDVHVQAITTAFLVAQLVLVLGAVIGLTFGVRIARRLVELGSLSLLGTLPAMFLAGLIAFDRHGFAAYWVFVTVIGLAIGIGAYLLTDRHGVDPLIGCLAIIVGLLVVDVATGARLQLNTMFGYTPTVGGRFAGIGNLAYAELSAAALLLAGLVAYRFGGRRGAVVATVLLVLALLVDAMPIWGSDVGGVLSMVPAYAIVVTALLGLRVRIRSAAIAIGATALAIVAFTLVDLSRPKDHQTHLGRLVSSIRADGWHSFAIVVERKLSANIDSLWPSQWTIMAPIVLAFVAFIVLSSPGGVRSLVARIPALGPALIGLAVLAVLGFSLNDSGIRIPAVMLGVLMPVLVVVLVRAHDDVAV